LARLKLDEKKCWSAKNIRCKKFELDRSRIPQSSAWICKDGLGTEKEKIRPIIEVNRIWKTGRNVYPLTTHIQIMILPFTIRVPQPVLDDLSFRLSRTRWPDEVAGADWNYGSNLTYLRDLIDYWHDKFDWRVQETAINKFANFRAEIDGLGLHFIHELGKGKNPMPIVLLHGWPATFLQMLKIIPLLTDPESYGGASADAFDVIVPSLPGFGFSERPMEKGMTVSHIADILASLMAELGYKRYAVRGSDMGAGVAQQLALNYPDSIVGVHISGTNPYVSQMPSDLSEQELKFLADVQRFRSEEGAYAMLQSTKPQTLAYGLNDSPAGLAAWIVEKFRAWSDCEGDLEKRFTKDELLTNLTVYWATETINSSCRLYYETMHNWPQNVSMRVEVPTGMAMFPKDLIPGPREWAERQFNVVRWTQMPRGGHFGEMEEPELLAKDILDFFRPLARNQVAKWRAF
jgi:pimeloyl-ACP methyl ester carboxylesterase